jgi:hypothetical protein
MEKPSPEENESAGLPRVPSTSVTTSSEPVETKSVETTTAVPDELSTQPASIEADVTVRVNLTQPGHPINPMIYGMTSVPVEMMEELHIPLRSWGGNPNSRYNWKLGNAWNAARDFVYVNGDYGYKGESASDDFIRENENAGAATRLTVPTLGWVAKDTSACSFPQPDGKCGMGDYGRCDKPGGPIADPYQTSVEAPPEFIGEWIDHLNSSGLKVEYFAMDNEPELWGITHYDVHPDCTTYDEILQRFVDYAAVVKEKAPQSQILGPVSCCWYFYWNTLSGTPDKLAHLNMDFLPWFLSEMAEYDQRNGLRLLDVLDIHYYPEGVYNDDTSPPVAAQRLRATRSLWDREYIDESWIDEPVYLIPRMRELIDEYYPGTLLAITEWNFGAEETMNGALAIAETLGVFGREQLDMATYYRYPEPNSPGAFAFKMFTNVDGKGTAFGDTYVPAESSDADILSTFVARDSATGRLMVLLINKDPARAYQVSVEGLSSAVSWKSYQYSSDDLTRIFEGELDPSNPLGLEVPPYSLTMLISGAGD